MASVIVTAFLTVSENKIDASVLLLVMETDRGHVIICHSRMFVEVLPPLFSLVVLAASLHCSASSLITSPVTYVV